MAMKCRLAACVGHAAKPSSEMLLVQGGFDKMSGAFSALFV